MIKMGEKYLVSAEDIYRTAINVSFRVGLNRYDKQDVRKILMDYSLIMNEICGENMIPWSDLEDWKIYSKLLESEATLEKVFNSVMSTRIEIESGEKNKEEIFKMPED